MFGEVVDGEMLLNDAGRMTCAEWSGLSIRWPHAELDQFVCMPNHFHGIIVLADTSYGVESCTRPQTNIVKRIDDNAGDHKDRPYGTTDGTIGRIVQAFKSLTTCKYTVGVKQHAWPMFQGKLWQRNYYEHVIRNEDDLVGIREYIGNNPARWIDDENNLKQMIPSPSRS